MDTYITTAYMENKNADINKSLKDFYAQQQAQTFYPLFLALHLATNPVKTRTNYLYSFSIP